jgi:hypothetical protein
MALKIVLVILVFNAAFFLSFGMLKLGYMIYDFIGWLKNGRK